MTVTPVPAAPSASAVDRPEPSIAMAALWMAGWLTLMIAIAIAGRAALRAFNVFQIMEVRCVVGFVLILPLVRGAGGFRAMRTAYPLRHFGRNTVHYAAQAGWFLALTMIPMGQVVAIEFTLAFWTAILAAIFLNERITAWKTAAVALGILGVVIIIRPATGAVNPGQLLALVVAMGFAVSIVLVKTLTRTDSTVAIIFWMIVIQGVLGILPAAYVWQWPTPEQWALFGVIGFCGTFSHFCMARAMLYADATVVVPMDFLRVPLTALSGWLLFADGIDALTVIGAVLILSGNALNLKSSRPVQPQSV